MHSHTPLYCTILPSSGPFYTVYPPYLSKERSFSIHTIRAYTNDIFNFIVWLDNTDPLKINSKTVGEYVHFIQKMNFSRKSTVNFLIVQHRVVWCLRLKHKKGQIK
jgi:site-specific recombinase XerD